MPRKSKTEQDANKRREEYLSTGADPVEVADGKSDPERVQAETNAANDLYTGANSNTVPAHNEGAIGDGAGGVLPSTSPTTGDITSTSATGTTGTTSGSSGFGG